MAIGGFFVSECWWLLMVIGGYFIYGYWLLFHYKPLAFVLLVIIDGY